MADLLVLLELAELRTLQPGPASDTCNLDHFPGRHELRGAIEDL